MFDDLSMQCIIFEACRYAALSKRTSVCKNDIIISIKRFKHGYDNFNVPENVMAVYESVFIDRRLPVFKKLVKSI